MKRTNNTTLQNIAVRNGEFYSVELCSQSVCCSLVLDFSFFVFRADLGLKLRDMLEASGIEPKDLGERTEGHRPVKA